MLIAFRFACWLAAYQFLPDYRSVLRMAVRVSRRRDPAVLSDSRGWGSRLLSVAAAMLIYVVNAVFITAVQVGGAAVALALA